MSVKHGETLKELQTRIAKIDVSLAAKKQEQAEISREITSLTDKRKEIEASIARMSRKNIQVTEHAVIRLLERKYNLPIEEEKQNLIDLISAAVGFSPSGKYPIGDGLRAIVKDRVVITVEKSW